MGVPPWASVPGANQVKWRAERTLRKTGERCVYITLGTLPIMKFLVGATAGSPRFWFPSSCLGTPLPAKLLLCVRIIYIMATGAPSRSLGTRGMPQKNLAPPVPVDRATDHQPQGRQSAVDKKRGQTPVKETAAILAKPAGVGEGGNFPSGSQTAWPPNKKPQFPYSRELRIAPVLLGPQVGGRPVSRGPVRPSYRQVFWLLDQSTPGAFPGRLSTPVAFSRFRPQLQRRDRDGFAPSSLFPYGTCKLLHTIPFGPGCQGESVGSVANARPNTKAFKSTPRAWATGGHLARRRNQTRQERARGAPPKKKAPGARRSPGPYEVDWGLGKKKRPGGRFWVKQI